MKIPVHYSLKVARKVVNKINLPKEIAKKCDVLSWSNCREQGLFIRKFEMGKGGKGFGKGVAIAQQRNSEDILVVCGTSTDFDFQTHQPSDELWDRDGARVHFRYDEVDKAARYIENFLKKE